MQVKCTTSESYIQQHLNNHPDIPVIINSEMAEYFKDHPNVIIDYDLSHETVQTVLADSVTYLDQFGSMQESVLTPFLALFVSSKRHYHLYEYGGYEAKDAALHTIVDTSAKVSGVLVGKNIGFGLVRIRPYRSYGWWCCGCFSWEYLRFSTIRSITQTLCRSTSKKSFVSVS
jgi:hypothetical protein